MLFDGPEKVDDSKERPPGPGRVPGLTREILEQGLL